MKPLKKLPIAATAVVAGVIFGTAAPGAAGVGTTSAVWNGDCSVVTTYSTKDISNLVYRIDGVDYRIEFQDGTHEYHLPGDATDVWIKAGNNKSDLGPGYGQHYSRPDSCDWASDA